MKKGREKKGEIISHTVLFRLGFSLSMLSDNKKQIKR